MKPEDYTKYFEAAQKYNEELAAHPSAFYNPDEIKDYEKILDITGTGIMGYITIKKLGVELPIYHGTDEGVLQIAAGHLKGTSFQSVERVPTVLSLLIEVCRVQSSLPTLIRWKSVIHLALLF